MSKNTPTTNTVKKLRISDVATVLAAVVKAGEGASLGLANRRIATVKKLDRAIGLSVLGSLGILAHGKWIEQHEAGDLMRKIAEALGCGTDEDMAELFAIFGMQNPRAN